MELSRGQLAALTGYSVDAIKDYERPDKKIDDKARQRYRLAVAAASFGIDFDWVDIRFKTVLPIEMTVRSQKR